MATKTSTNEISGLAALEPKTDPQIMALASDTGSTSTDILANMQKRAAELTSPWHAFQTGLDSMVARTHYDPTQAIASMEQKKANEAAELQNIGTTKAQVDLLRGQLGSMRGTFDKLSGKPTIGGNEKTTIDLSKGEQFILGVDGNPIKLNPYELENLKHYVDTNDIAGFKAAYKAISDYRGKESAITNELFSRPEAFKTETRDIVAYDDKGQLHNFGKYTLSLTEARDWELTGRLPKSLREAGYHEQPPPQKTIQKKATGGHIIDIPHMADGASVTLEGANYQPQLDTQQAYTDPMGNIANDNQSQAQFDPSLLENALAGITGSGNAQAQQKVIQNQTFNPDYQKESALSSQLHEQTLQQEKNKAELESERKEREEAGIFVGKIGSLASTFDEIERRSNSIINHASKHPDEFAYKKQTGPYSYLLSSVEGAPFIDGAKLANTLEAYKEKVSGQDTIDRRSETQGHADSLGIEYTQEKFAGTGARIGQGLTQIAQNAKNIGIDKTAKTNLINAYMIQATAGKYKEWAQAWQDYKKANPKNPNPFTFQTSPEYKAVEAKWGLYLDNKLNALENGVPANGTRDVDKNGNPIIWKDGKPMRAK